MVKVKKAFVVPTIVIVGTVLFFILAYALNAVVTNRGTIVTSHEQMLARQAAESGIAYARSCILKNNLIVTWSDENPLRPNTDCNGQIITDYIDETGNLIKAPSAYVLETEYYRSSFEVKPSDVGDEYKNVSALGKLDILRKGTDEVTGTRDFRMLAYISTGVTFNDVVFGSLYVGSGFNDLYGRSGQESGFSKSVYFFTKTHLGQVSSVGYNMDGVLTGYLDNNVIPWSQRAISDPKEFYPAPYALNMPHHQQVKKIFTDFQGNGWVTFFLGVDGRTVHGTGSNINCDLGLGRCDGADNSSASRPIWNGPESKMDVSNIPETEKIIDIKYNSATYVLTDAGKLYGNGRSNFGPGLGQDFDNSSVYIRVNKPTLIRGEDGFDDKKIVAFYTDSYYNFSQGSIAVAVTDDGYLYGWGRGGNQVVSSTRPRLLLRPSNLGGAKIIDAVTDGGTVWALDNQGRVWAAGNNSFGQLGRNSSGNMFATFANINLPVGERVAKMVADAYSALFLTESGSVYGVGLNNVSQLGFSKNVETCAIRSGSIYLYFGCSKTPRRYELPSGVIAQDLFIVSPGAYKTSNKPANYQEEADKYRNSFVITNEGDVYGAGANNHGQLGIGRYCAGEAGFQPNPSGYDTPQKMILENKNNDSGVAGDEDKKVRAKQVRSGLGTTIVITEENRVFTVGNNSYGQLGSGNQNECHLPKRHRYTNVFKTWYY